MDALKVLDLHTYHSYDFNGSTLKLNIDDKETVHAIDLGNCVIVSKNDFHVIEAVLKSCREHTRQARAFAKSINSLLPPELVPTKSEKH